METKVNPDHYQLIRSVIEDTIYRLQADGSKPMYAYLNAKAVMDTIYAVDTAYIVGPYLVVYQIASPWYAPEDCLYLNELLVLRLTPGGRFRIVPAFLKRKALEAGAVMAVVGTALAKSDTALASLYKPHGFTQGALVLTLET